MSTNIKLPNDNARFIGIACKYDHVVRMGSRPIVKSYSPDIILREVKKHLDEVLSGTAPCGIDEYSLSSYAAIRALIESLEKYGVDVIDDDGWDCPTSPDGKCHYSGSNDSCDYCGQSKNKNELPPALLEKMIQYSSNEGDLVCDLFLGGFSTARTAIAMNRRATGFEISKQIFDAKNPMAVL